MAEYNKAQCSSINNALKSNSISFDSEYKMQQGGIAVSEPLIPLIIKALKSEISGSTINDLNDLINYVKWTRRPLPTCGRTESILKEVLDKEGITETNGRFRWPALEGMPTGRPVQYDELETIIKSAMVDYNEEHTDKISSQNVMVKLENMILRADKARLDAIIEDLMYDGNGSLNAWLRELYEFWHIIGDFDIFATMFGHWMWACKRRFCMMTAENEILINIFGGQSTGKTKLLRTIFNEVFTPSMWYGIGLQTVMDEREKYLWHSKAVLMMDELRGDRVYGKELGDMKEMITADEVYYRFLGKNAGCTAEKTATMIATSNFHLSERINDDTGMRRFIEFEIDSHIEFIDAVEWNAKLKHLTDGAKAAFRDIDIINNDDGYWLKNSTDPKYADVNSRIKAIQESYPVSDQTSDWLRQTFRYDSDITLRNVQITFGSTEEPGSVVDLYTKWYKREHLNDQMLRNSVANKTLRNKIISIFGEDAFYTANGHTKDTKLVLINPEQQSTDAWSRPTVTSTVPSCIATPVATKPATQAITGLEEFSE